MFCTPHQWLRPVADIIKRHNLTYHLYADDSQLYVSFKLGSDDLLFSAKSSIKICIREIKNWMILSGLRLNEEKTECFYSVHVISPVLHWNLFVLGVTVRYVGVILDPSADIEDHREIQKIYKTCHFHLINISRIRTFIWIVNLLKQLFMLSWLPAWITVSNAILYGLS